MIFIPPPWKGRQAEDIWALYYFLLYETVPFEPKDYLPGDAIGFFYYENGDRSGKKCYPDKPRKQFSPPKNLPAVISHHTIPPSMTMEAFINWISPQLHDYLYKSGAVQRRQLVALFTTQTDTDTLRREKLQFSLNCCFAADSKRAKAAVMQLLLSAIFDYHSLSRHDLFPKLIQLMGVEVCPYCNRNFTTTVRGPNGKYHRQNQVDHYRSKSKYPWFALTLPNLIPACGNCNLKKGDYAEDVLYPYLEEFGEQYHFRTTMKSTVGYLTGSMVSPDDFAVEIKRNPAAGAPKDPAYDKRVQTSIRKFGLDVLYRESHNDYVRAIFEQRYIFSDAYLDALMASFPDLFESREAVRQLLYLKRYDADGLGTSPLAKLTRDIDAEISSLTAGKKP